VRHRLESENLHNRRHDGRLDAVAYALQVPAIRVPIAALTSSIGIESVCASASTVPLNSIGLCRLVIMVRI
jgi:hypothetical protein